MSLQTPRSRAWSKITAASTDRIAKKKSQLYRTLSKHNCPVPQCEAIAEENGNIVSDQKFSSQDTEELDQSNIYDEKAFAQALNEINNELDSLRSLYNSQWFTDMRKSLDKSKNKKQAANVGILRSTVTTEHFPRNTPSNNEMNVSQYRQNITSLMSTALAEQRQSPLKKEVNEPNMGRKILPPHHGKQIGDDKEFNKKIVEIQENVSTLTGVPAGDVTQTSKEVLRMMNVISNARKEENINKTLHADSQSKFSKVDNKPLYNNFTHMLCEVDKITNELTELQRFKDAIYAMNEEFERTETEASTMSATLMLPQSHSPHSTSKVQTVLQKPPEKRSPRLSYSSTKINIPVQETNRKINKIKMPHTEMMYNSQFPKTFINTLADKQESNTELLKRREIPVHEKKKGTMNHNSLPTKQKLVVHSLPYSKNRVPQGHSEKVLPLEVNPLNVNISAAPASKQSTTNKMSKKSSPKMCKPIATKRSIK